MKERIEEINKADMEMINSHCNYTMDVIKKALLLESCDGAADRIVSLCAILYKSAWIHGVKHERERIEAMK